MVKLRRASLDKHSYFDQCHWAPLENLLWVAPLEALPGFLMGFVVGPCQVVVFMVLWECLLWGCDALLGCCRTCWQHCQKRPVGPQVLGLLIILDAVACLLPGLAIDWPPLL